MHKFTLMLSNAHIHQSYISMPCCMPGFLNRMGPSNKSWRPIEATSRPYSLLLGAIMNI